MAVNLKAVRRVSTDGLRCRTSYQDLVSFLIKSITAENAVAAQIENVTGTTGDLVVVGRKRRRLFQFVFFLFGCRLGDDVNLGRFEA